ncbi:MAG: 50S ribosomal protein L11 methyltransferase [Chloroflexi bacterium]|nr:50S ribosomal protein L11 methyltransferase [Chloroflexota bacterium]
MSAQDGPENGDWLEIAVVVAGIDAETIADIFRQTCEGGAAIQPSSRLDRETDTYVLDGDGPAIVKGYLRPGAESSRLQDSLRIAVDLAPLLRPAEWREVTPLPETSWRDEWKKYFGLQRIGRSLVIRPSWVDYDRNDSDVVIEIDPGLAFGTGQHPTTAMCLRALEQLVEDRMSVLDIGCGSGILSIAAAKLGAARVLAVDTDPQAVSATQANVAVNSIGAVEVREGTLDVGGTSDERFDIVVANISGLAIERLAPAIAGVLKPRGRLIASGFLDDAVGTLTSAFAAVDLTVERVVEDGVWRAMLARRGDA